MSAERTGAAARIAVGATLTRELEVVEELTVGHVVAGMPFVLATPQMIYHMEIVAAALIADCLPQGWVSVGTRVEVTHLAATPIGMRVSTTAVVLEIEERNVTFEVSASDGVELIGRGRHSRSLVALERFLAGTARKRAMVS